MPKKKNRRSLSTPVPVKHTGRLEIELSKTRPLGYAAIVGRVPYLAIRYLNVSVVPTTAIFNAKRQNGKNTRHTVSRFQQRTNKKKFLKYTNLK